MDHHLPNACKLAGQRFSISNWMQGDVAAGHWKHLAGQRCTGIF
jgi:hypothetical protein